MRLGILGGTFDPVHIGHLALAEQAREQLEMAQVLWVPAGDPWRKTDRAVTAAQHRVNMVRLAIEGQPAFDLCTLETERRGPSYSVDTLAILHEQHAESELVFLVGADALADLPNWHEPERLLQLVTLAVADRDGERPSLETIDRIAPEAAQRVLWVEMPRLDIGATELRTRAAEGRSLRYLVPDAVEAYIRDRGLYQAG